jgi:hypothetical protein
VVVVNSTLRRLYPISCPLQVGNGVLSRFGRVRFPRGPFEAAFAKMDDLGCFMVERIASMQDI